MVEHITYLMKRIDDMPPQITNERTKDSIRVKGQNAKLLLINKITTSLDDVQQTSVRLHKTPLTLKKF